MVFPQKTRTEIKPLMGNTTGNTDKGFSTSKNDEIEEQRLNLLGRKKKNNTTFKTTRGERKYKRKNEE